MEHSDWLFKALKLFWYYSRTLAVRSRVSDFDVVEWSIALRRDDRSTYASLDRLLESSEISSSSVISRCSAARDRLSSNLILDFYILFITYFLSRIKSLQDQRHFASHKIQNDICIRLSHQSTRLRRVVIFIFIVIVIFLIISEKELFWTRKWVYHIVNQEMKIVKSSRHEFVSHVSRWFREMNRTKLQDNNKQCTEITTQLFT